MVVIKHLVRIYLFSYLLISYFNVYITVYIQLEFVGRFQTLTGAKEVLVSCHNLTLGLHFLYSSRLGTFPLNDL